MPPRTKKEYSITFTSPEASDHAESCELGKQLAGGSVADLRLCMRAPQAPRALPGRQFKEVSLNKQITGSTF